MACEPARTSTELGDFQHFLRRRGIVRRLTEILSDVTSDSSDSLTSNTRGELVTNCLSLFVLELCNPDGYLWLPQALRSGLLGCMARIANLFDSGVHISNLRKLLEYTQRATVYYSVVQNFACRLPNASVHADSPIYSQWMKFMALAQERLDTTDVFDDPECGPHRVCDNLEANHFTYETNSILVLTSFQCGRIMEKSKFKACAGCCTVYYCDSSCQRADWTDHRMWCGRLRLLYLRSSTDLL